MRTFATKASRRGNVYWKSTVRLMFFDETTSLRKHSFLLALRRWGRFACPQLRKARRNGCFRRLWNDGQQELHDLLNSRDRYLSNGLSWGQPISHYSMSNNGFRVIVHSKLTMDGPQHIVWHVGKPYICTVLKNFCVQSSQKPSHVKYNIYVAALCINTAVTLKSNVTKKNISGLLFRFYKYYSKRTFAFQISSKYWCVTWLQI